MRLPLLLPPLLFNANVEEGTIKTPPKRSNFLGILSITIFVKFVVVFDDDGVLAFFCNLCVSSSNWTTISCTMRSFLEAPPPFNVRFAGLNK